MRKSRCRDRQGAELDTPKLSRVHFLRKWQRTTPRKNRKFYVVRPESQKKVGPPKRVTRPYNDTYAYVRRDRNICKRVGQTASEDIFMRAPVPSLISPSILPALFRSCSRKTEVENFPTRVTRQTRRRDRDRGNEVNAHVINSRMQSVLSSIP